MTPFHIVIPARYHSTRLPGKVLLEINGMTILERVYRQALQAAPASICIATDHTDVFDHARAMGAHVELTAATHPSGTDRIAELVARQRFAPDDIIVNVQGDEPFIPPLLIQQVARMLTQTDAPMGTLCWPIEEEAHFYNPHVVKVVRDHAHHALYFSRSPIPAHRDKPHNPQHVFRHIGLYAYRSQFLLQMVHWPVCEIESLEALEQLRVLWAGYKIKVEVACVPPQQDINTQDDLNRVLLEQ